MTARKDEETPKPSLRERLDLSFSQVLGGALAAVTSAVAASYLGVAGTLIGAALGSVIITVGTSIYKLWLRSTNERLRKVVPVQALSNLRVVPEDKPSNRRPSNVRGAGAPRPADETTLLPKLTDPSGKLWSPPDAPPPEPVANRWLTLFKRLPWPRIAVVAAIVFVLSTGVVVAAELIGGGSLSSLLHGRPDGGTSIGGGHAPQQGDFDRRPSEDRSPAQSRSPESTPSPTPSSIPTPSRTPSPTPSTPQSPTVSPSAPPQSPAGQEPTPP
ncbi:hypothetical protein [Fodinicola acaciae]|uniref:hypothetical protein n=1 Tax=Fodinicola acaciae TaxID=2681555 RepID=UPI0013D037D9|nr:hypothetical protein [Fodinicola acaciae]